MSITAIAAGVQTSADTYTRYELLPPTTHSFRIYYDVSAATEGATRYYNPIRRGSDPDVHGVYDRMTGQPLEWALVDVWRANCNFQRIYRRFCLRPFQVSPRICHNFVTVRTLSNVT